MLKLNHDIEEYILLNSSPESDVLYALNRQTNLDAVQPRMLSGHLQGKVLEMISFMVKPKMILELGTFTGYSAICLASGLTEEGKLITIEKNDEMVPLAEEYIKKAGLENKIEVLIGDALDFIDGFEYKFDLVFIDADKKEYTSYYKKVLPKLQNGGFILADNVLWDGKVVDSKQQKDPDTLAIIEFNRYVQNDPLVENVILPIRDGISLIRKK